MSLPAVKLERPATRADLDALPEHMKGELIDGVLYAMTRPRGQHQNVSGLIYANLVNAFQRGRGGPGGWWILVEPGIELPGAPEVAPCIAGWKRGRLPELPRDRSLALAPDWVCEVLSPTTRGYHFLVKREVCQRAGVSFLWEVDLEAETVTVLQLEESRWVVLGSFSRESDARIAPFDEMPSDVLSWWSEAQ